MAITSTPPLVINTPPRHQAEDASRQTASEHPRMGRLRPARYPPSSGSASPRSPTISQLRPLARGKGRAVPTPQDARSGISTPSHSSHQTQASNSGHSLASEPLHERQTGIKRKTGEKGRVVAETSNAHDGDMETPPNKKWVYIRGDGIVLELKKLPQDVHPSEIPKATWWHN